MKDIKKVSFFITQGVLLITSIIVVLIGIKYSTPILVPMLPIVIAEIAIVSRIYIDFKNK